MFKKWHVSFHLATHPANLQSRLYKTEIFSIILKKYFAISKKCSTFAP